MSNYGLLPFAVFTHYSPTTYSPIVVGSALFCYTFRLMNNSPDLLRQVNLLSMNRGDSLAFSRKVATRGGILPVYVHLDYADDIPESQGEILTAYQQRSDAEVTSLLAEDAPIVAFKESTKPHPLPTRLRNTASGTLYVVHGDPTPVDADGYIDETRWDEVRRVFHDAQVKEVQLGGSLAHACVMITGDRLKERGFNITFPLALFPPYPPVLTTRCR